MSRGKDRIVYRRTYGVWVNKRSDCKKATSLHASQNEAINAARSLLERQGGGRLTVMKADGKIYNKDIIAREAVPPDVGRGRLAV
ncbi:MAG: DUF2188 domain-containing protein [Thermodesulfobacteriota bacterium]